MKKKYSINKQSIELDSSMGWLLIYKDQFGHDILPDLLPVLETILGSLGEIANEIGDSEDFEEAIVSAIISDRVQEKLFEGLYATELTTIINIFWAMAKNNDDSLPLPEDFAKTLDKFPIDEIAPKLFRQIINSCISSKNLKRLQERIPQLTLTK